MNTAVSQTVASWARRANWRLVLQAQPALLAGALGALLLGRGVGLLHQGLGIAVAVAGALAAGIAAAGWIRTRRWTPDRVAARVDRIAQHHDLVQTALAIERGAAVGDEAFQAQVVAAARQALPGCAATAAPPLSLHPAPVAALALILGLHAALPWFPQGSDSNPGLPGSRAGVALTVPRTGPTPPTTSSETRPGSALLDERDGARGAPGRGSASGATRVVKGSSRGAAAAAAKGAAPAAEDEAALEALAAATEVWVPGAGGGGDGGPMQGNGPMTGQESAGSAGVRDGDKAAPDSNEREQAAGGAAPTDADEADAVEGLQTLEGGDNTDEGGTDGSAGAQETTAPDATGEDAEETLTSRNQPSSGELGEGRDEDMEGESGAGSSGPGGANAASGSAEAIADSRPPEWELAAEWVEARWREAPTGQLRTVEDGQTGRRSSVAFQEIAARYEAIAEGDARPELVPPTRRAYITRYFDRLSDPPPGAPDGD